MNARQQFGNVLMPLAPKLLSLISVQSFCL
jgi:hypothetical protein